MPWRFYFGHGTGSYPPGDMLWGWSIWPGRGQAYRISGVRTTSLLDRLCPYGRLDMAVSADKGSRLGAKGIIDPLAVMFKHIHVFNLRLREVAMVCCFLADG